MKYLNVAICLVVISCLLKPTTIAADFGDFVPPIITLAGTNYNRLLVLEGYDILSSNVNWNVPNTYHVTYRLKNGSKTKQREVVVLNQYDFSNKGYEHTRTNDQIFVTTSFQKEILSYVIIDQENIAIAYSEYDPHDLDAGSTISIAWLQNQQLLWESKLRQNSYDYITNISYDNNEIIAIGVNYDNLTHQDGWIIRLTRDGTITHDVTYPGNQRDFFYDLIVLNDSYIVVGKSNSNQGLFVGKKTQGLDYDALMVIVNKQTMGLSKVMMYGSNGDDSFDEVIIHHQHLFLKTSTMGLIGEFADGIHLRRTGIVKLDITGSIEQTNFLTTISNMKLEKIITNDQGTMYGIVGYDNISSNKRMYQIYQINLDGSFSYLDEYIYPNTNANISLVDAQICDNQIILLHQLNLYLQHSTQLGYYIRVYEYDNFVEEFEYRSNHSQIYPKGLLCQQSIDVIGTSTQQVGGNKISMFSTLRAIIPSIGSLVANKEVKEIEDYQVIVNQEYITHNIELSKTFINHQMFGYYQLEYVFNHDMLIIAFSKEVYVSDRINVRSNESYSKGYLLQFNGVGYLNDTKVLSGTPINQTGSYVLEVFGKDEVKKMFSFQIVDNVENRPSHLLRNQKPDIKTIEITPVQPNSIMKVTFIDKMIPTTDLIHLNQFEHWFYIFPIACIPTTILIIVKGAKQ